MEDIQAVLLCAGKSERMGEDKMRLSLGGAPVWQRALTTLLNIAEIRRVVLVASSAVAREAEQAGLARERVHIVRGGETRQQSVYNGLLAMEGADIAVIHDAARCLCTEALVRACIEAARQFGSGVAGVPATDTLKRMEDGWAVETLDREAVFQAQTPQTFRYPLIREAYEQAIKDGVTATDDAMLLERMGHKVRMVQALSPNFKLTTAHDAQLARGILGISLRVGYGEDAHRLAEGRRLVLGGVEIPHGKGLLGHSDADVLAHAVSDALLGATALGDIGAHFPENERYKDADSLQLLGEVCALLRGNGFAPVNIDATVIAQTPRLAPHIAVMRVRLAQAMGMNPSAVSVKATTTEGMGFEGRGEGISVRCVAMVSGGGVEMS